MYKLFNNIFDLIVKVVGVKFKSLVVGMQTNILSVLFAIVRNEINAVYRVSADRLDDGLKLCTHIVKLTDVSRVVVFSPDRSNSDDGSIRIKLSELVVIRLSVGLEALHT